jgi:hypothetical protein
VTGDDIRQALFRPALGGYRFSDVDEMLEQFADALDGGQSPDVVTPTVQLRKSLRGYNVGDVERFLQSLDLRFRPLVRRPWSPTDVESIGPSAVDVTRLLLGERGVSIGLDAARRVAEHLLGPTSLGEHRAVEIQGRPEQGEPRSVVITTGELDEAMRSLHLSSR